MNFAQLHEALRLEILRRIERGVLSGSLLARQTGFRQAHISNFLHRRRLLSLNALDRVLHSQRLSASDLLSSGGAPWAKPRDTGIAERLYDTVPLVSQSCAIHDPQIAAHDVILEVRLPPGTLGNLRQHRSRSRRDWQRFVAIRITAVQAEAMKPILSAHAIVFLDRHYNSLTSYRQGPTLYAVATGNTLSIRYVSLDGNRLILRPYSLSHRVELIEIGPNQSVSELLVGRAYLALVEL